MRSSRHELQQVARRYSRHGGMAEQRLVARDEEINLGPLDRRKEQVVLEVAVD